LKAAIRRYSKPLADLVARDANEGDTRLLVTDFLCDGLGFDKYADLTTEYQVKGEFADYGVRIDRELVAFIEVKRVATKLSTRHLRQVEMYAINEGVEWIILTNGSGWQVCHITGGLPVAIDLDALSAELLAVADQPCSQPWRPCGSDHRGRRSRVVKREEAEPTPTWLDPLHAMQFPAAAALQVRRRRPAQRPSPTDRDCPLDTARDRCLWHAGGTAGESGGAYTWPPSLQLDC
jgi:hypothetical protein